MTNKEVKDNEVKKGLVKERERHDSIIEKKVVQNDMSNLIIYLLFSVFSYSIN